MVKDKKKKRLVLLDSHAILHRAYHALPDFATSKGEPTGALYGLSAMLIKIINDLKPDYLVACYDLPKPTYRHEAYEAYKAGRKKAEEDLVSQMKKSRDVFNAFGIPMYDKEGFEADDVLGTIVEKVKNEKGLQVIIASGDMDTLQLVSDKKVQVYTLKKGINDTIMYDEDAVRERFGFGPELMPDYKGLRGDPSDNIVGVKGIGEKTATVLIQKFGSIENIYKTLKKDEEALKKEGIKERMVGILKENEEEAIFSKMLATIRKDAPIDFELPKKIWKEDFDLEKTRALFAELEFRNLLDRVRNAVAPETATLGFGGAKKEEPVVVAEDIPSDELRDASVALWLIDSNITSPGLKDILQFSGKNNFKDSKEAIFKELEKRGLKKVFDEIEKPLMPVINKMGKRGVLVDTDYLKKLSEEYTKELKVLEKKIWDKAGQEFNINSPKQLSVILFEKLGLKLKNHKKTSGGVKSTKESELYKMKDLHPIIEHIISYRELQKLLGTYINNIPDLLGEGGRLHATFKQDGTTTGRMSSENPNLQNIPVKSDLGKKIREAFVAPKGYKLLAIDYSQIDLRSAAILSKDDNLLEVFKNKRDIHTEVAAKIFNVPSEKVDYEMRRKAKVINFGIIYGMGILALKTNLGVSKEEAQFFHSEYFKNFKGLADYLERVKSDVERKGYTETFFGRRRYFEGINSKISYIKAAAERMAINAPIQGTSSDVIKIAMARVDDYIKDQKLEEKIHLILQVHDELVYEIKEDGIKAIAKQIKDLMEGVLKPEETGGVVFEAKASVGDNWGEMKNIPINE